MIENRQIIDFATVAETLLVLLKRNKIRHKKVGFVLSNLNVITKKIQVSGALNDAEIESQIQLNFSRYISYPVEETFFDFTVLPNQKKDVSTLGVMLVAVHKSQIVQYQQLVKICRLSLEVIDVDSHVLQRCYRMLNFARHEDFCAMACLNHDSVSLHIVEREETYLAEYKTLNSSLSDEAYLGSLVTWFKRNFQVFEVSNRGMNIKTLYVYGDRAEEESLVKSIEVLIGIEICIIDPFNVIKQSKLALECSASYVMAVGLSMREEEGGVKCLN